MSNGGWNSAARVGVYNHSFMIVTVRSFAKVNLGLRIGAPRADGFHELLTVYQTIGLHDVIRVSVERGSGIEIRCEDPRVPRDASNTCYRIVERAIAALRAKGRVIIDIEKRLPVQGGLGGASANAVATLLALQRALRKSLTAVERLEIAAEVGSDLPLFLVGGTVLGVGRGEQVYPVPDFPSVACVVVTPEIGVSTPRAFDEWDRRQGLKPRFSAGSNAGLKARSSTAESDVAVKRRSSTEPRAAFGGASENPVELRSTGQPGAAVPTEAKTSKLTTPIGSDRMDGLGYGLSAWLSEWYSGAPFRRGRAENPLLALDRAGIENDFEQVVFPEYPELGEAKRALLRAGAKYASLSGSGSTLYGLFASRQAAASAVSKLRKAGWAAQATVTLTRAAYWRQIFKK
jgi:4-diphosphocytidyl-2-C-methyl-D-erythritol kinase